MYFRFGLYTFRLQLGCRATSVLNRQVRSRDDNCEERQSQDGKSSGGAESRSPSWRVAWLRFVHSRMRECRHTIAIDDLTKLGPWIRERSREL